MQEHPGQVRGPARAPVGGRRAAAARTGLHRSDRAFRHQHFTRRSNTTDSRFGVCVCVLVLLCGQRCVCVCSRVVSAVCVCARALLCGQRCECVCVCSCVVSGMCVCVCVCPCVVSGCVRVLVPPFAPAILKRKVPCFYWTEETARVSCSPPLAPLPPFPRGFECAPAHSFRTFCSGSLRRALLK